MGKKERKELLGQVRFPNPPPDRPHSGKKGDKGYDRKKEKKDLYNKLQEED